MPLPRYISPALPEICGMQLALLVKASTADEPH
jgi:hypothetical protein